MEEPNKSGNLTEAMEFEYEIPNPGESIVDFKRRVEEQIELLRTGIQNGNVKDPKEAEDFVKKAERFLSIPFFSDNESQDKKVYDLKKRIGTIIIANDIISTIITDWLCLKGDSKVTIANEGKSKKEQGSFSFREEM